MKRTNRHTIFHLILAGAAVIALSACGTASLGSRDTDQNYYDQYMDRAGYRDFARPVVFLPNEPAIRGK